mmetsp:Transcript_38590/g.46680  ORF Transcript_38590/g.46680 Transcript_38590/m.46680 type:complete len:150 (+) Transcript_38590:119-568(+)|eukprot:CAMPEP_0197849938 /NCGR_PEP_ID=MMETSP1438-20131217/13720_1 /TAXON_ID=1461541 /ORGANISM="Pterosperma sp., Strain CCMP1384" /LENGTH=149 /DNA_ID=CAMNT_0043462849 /DNA_START=107 /DNA_END=556 /DNA_ORIENTATION=-
MPAINSPTRCESPTAAKWRVQVEQNPLQTLHNADCLGKSTTGRSVQENPKGHFNQVPRFQNNVNFACEATKKGPDPYHVKEDNDYLKKDKTLDFKTGDRFKNNAVKTCRMTGMDPYHVKDKNTWTTSSNKLTFKKERWPGIEPETRMFG